MSSIPQPIVPSRDRILSNLLGLSAAYFAADLGFPEPAPHPKPTPAAAPWALLPGSNPPAHRYVQAVATGIGRPATG